MIGKHDADPSIQIPGSDGIEDRLHVRSGTGAENSKCGHGHGLESLRILPRFNIHQPNFWVAAACSHARAAPFGSPAQAGFEFFLKL
jgi:hypothetical protein